MPKIFVQPGSDKSMIVLNKNRAGEIFAESIDGRPSDCDSRNQERDAQPPHKVRSSMDTANICETKNHSDRLDEVGDIPELR